MSPNQEEAFFDYLENETEPFTLEEITSFVQLSDPKHIPTAPDNSLFFEIASFLETKSIAFKIDTEPGPKDEGSPQINQKWISRRGCFEQLSFVITPTRLELANGILIPGHRCVPFANPIIMPHEYVFFLDGKPIPVTTTEGLPEDFYPYYSIFGEEYAPQYIARDNPENEAAFNFDPYDDISSCEVSIRTLDMRNLYRELGFIPGDCFIVSNLEWKLGHFNLEKISKNEWSNSELLKWVKAAECGFQNSFAMLGPGASTEEQVAYAYWYGGKRMRETPAYSLEEFLYKKTESIETVQYGIETRFWYSGKEIPDAKTLEGIFAPPDRTYIEDIFLKLNIPISEFVVISYVRDAFFRNEKDIDLVLSRIIPPVINIDEADWAVVAEFIADCFEEIRNNYSLFLDQGIASIRQRVAELHTAVIDLSTSLQKSEIEPSWMPKHTFIVLSQIQGHAAGLLEDLAFDDFPPESELEIIDNSLDSMIETYGDIKELLDEAMNNFRRNNLIVVHGGKDKYTEGSWLVIQISICGTDIWRRALVPREYTLEELHFFLQAGFDWKNIYNYCFFCESSDKQFFPDKMMIGDVCSGFGQNADKRNAIARTYT